jgi:hypothetical protein
MSPAKPPFFRGRILYMRKILEGLRSQYRMVTALPIEDFNGNTFVGFLDICGFKDMMTTKGQAERSLDRFFTSVYQEVQSFRRRDPSIDCIAVSDCAVAFARTSSTSADQAQESFPLIKAQCLNSILIFVKNIAQKMIRSRVAIKGSIAYGSFQFQHRIEIPGVAKEMFVGNAYLDAYMDVEKGKPKLRPGEIRIKPRTEVEQILQNSGNDFGLFSLIHPEKGNHYFYWMLPSINRIDDFENELQDRYRRRYEGVISVIRRYAEMALRQQQTRARP